MALDKSRYRKIVIGPFSGQEYVIRRITVSDFLLHLGQLPIEESATLKSQLEQISSILEKAARVADSEIERKMMRFYLERGVIEPKIFFGPEKECPEDELLHEDMKPDAFWLVKAITEFSFDFQGIKSLEPFFFQPSPADPGHDGNEVRKAADGASPKGSSP